MHAVALRARRNRVGRFDLDTLPTGSYTVRVDGVGAGNPLDTGYSDYASVGAYTVSLTATAA